MTKSVFILLLCLLVQGCSLFDGNEIDPELDLITPQYVSGDSPVAIIGSSLRIQANMSVKNGGIERYVITLVRSLDNQTVLSEIVHDFSDRPDGVFVDTLLAIPSSLTPSQTDREYSMSIRMEYEGGSLGVGQPVVLETE